MSGPRENKLRDVFTDDLQLSPETFFDGRNVEEISPDDFGVSKSSPPKSDGSPQWTGDDDVLRPPGDKPKRPLSAYNFFFQLERERIIQGTPDERDKVVEYTVEDVKRIAALQIEKAKAGKPKEKRSHRRTHGKISFGDLARTIANKWKKLDDSKKTVFEGSAMEEKERYRRELQEWNKQQKKWKEATAKMTHFHHHRRDHLFSPSIVTPTQHPRATLQSTDQHLMTTLMKQQKRLLEESGFVSSDSPPNLTPTSDSQRQVYADDLIYGRRVSADYYGRPSSFTDRSSFSDRGSSYSGSNSDSSPSNDRSTYNDFFGGDARRSDLSIRSPSSSMYDYGRAGEGKFQSGQSKLPNYQQIWLQQRRMQLMEEQQQHQRYAYDLDSPLDRTLDNRAFDRSLDRSLDRSVERSLDRPFDRVPTPTDNQGPLRDDPNSNGYMSPHAYHQDDFGPSGEYPRTKHYTAL